MQALRKCGTAERKLSKQVFGVGSVNAGLGQESVVLGKTWATAAMLLGGIAVPLRVPDTAAALGMEEYGPLNASVTTSSTVEKLLQSFGGTETRAWRGRAAEPSHPARSCSPQHHPVADVLHSDKCSINNCSTPLGHPPTHLNTSPGPLAWFHPTLISVMPHPSLPE